MKGTVKVDATSASVCLGSVSEWIVDAREGSDAAMTQLWSRYQHHVSRIAQRCLNGSVRSVADEEDVVVDVFRTFARRLQQGTFANLSDRNGLWALLVRVTQRKAANQIRDLNRIKRGGRFNRIEADGKTIDRIASRGVDPTLIVDAIEEFRWQIDQLDEEFRLVAIHRLEGRSPKQIAELLQCSVPTVYRRLSSVEDLLQDMKVR